MRENEGLGGRIEAANKGLDKCAIREKAGRLYIRSRHFPPKRPSDSPGKQYDIPVGCNANPAGLKVAIARAKEIDAQLIWGRFDWGPYLRGADKPAETVGEWVKRYEAAHWERTERSPNKEDSFHKGYRLYHLRLPQDKPLTAELLRSELVEQSKPAKRSRELMALAFRRLGEFAGLDKADLLELKRLGEGYKANAGKLHTLPTDEQIWEALGRVSIPGWRWIYAVLAVYGLRPHETFFLDFSRFDEDIHLLYVKEGKTGPRWVYPIPAPRWDWLPLVSDRVLPPVVVEGRSHNALGTKVSQEFREMGLGLLPYDLRDCHARRGAERGFGPDFLARNMGHSIDVHMRHYRVWWAEDTFGKIYRKIMD